MSTPPSQAMPCLCRVGVAYNNIPAVMMSAVFVQGSPARLFENITAVSTQSSTNYTTLLLDLPCPANLCIARFPRATTPTLLPTSLPPNAHSLSPRARLVLSDLTLTEQLPTSLIACCRALNIHPLLLLPTSAIPASDEFVCTSPRKHIL